jgi:pimeloyl-ACP methyl ester carboxylesterase
VKHLLARRGASPQLRNSLLLASVAALAGLAADTRDRTRRAEAEHPPEGRFIEVEGVRLHYLEQGTGSPVVLLHGNGVTAEDFRISGLFAALAKSHRVVVFDRPGYGHSGRPRWRLWTPGAQAKLLLQAIEALDMARPVVVGHSWGTLVAMAMAQETNALRGLVLLAGYYFPTARADVPLVVPIALPLVGDGMRHTVSPLLGRLAAPRMLRKLFAPRPVPPHFARQHPLGLTLRPSQLRASAEEATFMIPAAAALQAQYRDMNIPVVIVAGDGDRVVDSARQSARLHNEMLGSVFQLLAGVGHMVHYAAVDAIADAVGRLATPAVGRRSRAHDTVMGTRSPE